MNSVTCDWCKAETTVVHLDGDNLCQECANKWVRGEGVAAAEMYEVEQGRWHVEPDPNQAEHDAVDQQRREAELEAQNNLTDAIDLATPEPIE